MELIKRSFTVSLKRCLILNKYLKTENLCYACNINPIQIEIIHRKLNFYLLLCNNRITNNIIKEISNADKIAKKSFIQEINDMIDGDFNHENVMNTARNTLKRIDEANRMKINSQIVIDIKFYLNNPNVINWRKLNDLLIPEALADKQEEFWGIANEEIAMNGEIDREFEYIRSDLTNQTENEQSININMIINL